MLELLTALIYLAAMAPLSLALWRNRGEILTRKLDPQKIKWPMILTVALLVGVTIGFKVMDLWVEYLWYEELGQTQVFLRPMLFKVTLGLVKFFFAATIWWFMTAWPLRYIPVLDVPVAPEGMNPWEKESWERSQNPARAHNRKWHWLNLGRVATIALGSLFLTLVFPVQWQQVMLWLNSSPVGVVDPIFGNDSGFYFFTYPLLQSLESHLFWIWLFGLSMVLMLMFWAIGSDKRVLGKEVVASLEQRYLAQLQVLAVPLLALGAWMLWLERYSYLFRQTGRVFGVSWLRDHYSIPACGVMAALLLTFAAWLAWKGLRGQPISGKPLIKLSAAFLVVLLLAVAVVPFALQRWVVVPQEKKRELPYLAHQMEATRFGYNLDHMKTQLFVPNDSLGLEDLKANAQILKNARLWDYRALSASLDRIQELKTFFDFPDVDIDRDTLNGEYASYLLASREMNIKKLPEQARNWQNNHLVYTHGHGVVMNRVSEFDEGGYPHLLIKDIPAVSSVREIQIRRPEIYFGELTEEYVILNTGVAEFSHISADSSVYTRYEGKAGVPLGSGLRRLAIAMHFGDSQILLSSDLTSESRVLWHRSIHERVDRLAPFLFMDDDEYKVIRRDGSLSYIIDGYTSSKYMPYSERLGDNISYIRNSVKSTVNAYDGAVRMYVYDSQDPILKAWRGIFPDLFSPAEQMPADLRKHVRYPEDLLNIQAAMLSDYHMERPEDFFGREDRWDVASEMYGSEKQTMEAYNILLQLPGETSPEFLLMLPFVAHNKQNMVGWVAGRSDGKHYGEMILYRFPQNKNVAGTMMIETNINQHPEWSQDLTLWRQKGSDVIQGNLLVIPMAHSLFYMEPIYLQAENEPMPQITRVVVALNERRLAWGRNLDEALNSLFQGQMPAPPSRLTAETGVVSDPSIVGQALQLLSAYKSHQATGQYAKAGEALEKLEKLLNTQK